MQLVNNINISFAEDVSDLDLNKLMRFITNEFHDYFSEHLSIIDTQLHACVKVDLPEISNMSEIYNSFSKFRDILEQHKGEEQHIMFPFIKNILNKKGISGVKLEILNKVIKNIENEHKKIKTNLDQLNKLTSGFEIKANSSATLKGVYHQLGKLKHVYLVYSFIEVNYLYPKLNELKNIM
ncbi:MAG: hemerythrin domain-containing protein [Bacteroidia bacterium]|nr:hemerythrin domain-containing protein [Bacteroidia bacterium]